MTSEVLHRVFSPRSIALVGASREPGKLGHNILNNLIEGGFKGKLFPINPEAAEVLGLKHTAYRSMSRRGVRY